MFPKNPRDLLGNPALLKSMRVLLKERLDEHPHEKNKIGRIRNVCEREKIFLLSQFLSYTPAEWLRVLGVAPKGVTFFQEIAAAQGFDLGDAAPYKAKIDCGKKFNEWPNDFLNLNDERSAVLIAAYVFKIPLKNGHLPINDLGNEFTNAVARRVAALSPTFADAAAYDVAIRFAIEQELKDGGVKLHIPDFAR